jgi:tRNA pseudouridine55 synthase
MQYQGVILLDKYSGMSSHDVVARARRIFNTKSIGHAGTLDPLASGLLVLLVGEATKLSQYILERDKSYEVEFKLGVSTDTLDITGQVLQEKPVSVTPAQIEAVAQSQKGDFNWPIPMYSASKVDGEKLYEKARRGEDFTPPSKQMSFFDLSAFKVVDTQENRYSLSLSCSKGSFIRTWVDELGKVLGCGATMTALRRTYSAPFQVKEALDLEELEMRLLQKQDLNGAFVPIERALVDVPFVRVKGQSESLLNNGTISYDLRTMLISKFNPDQDQWIQVFSENGKLLALMGVEPGVGFKIQRVFRY